MDCKVFSSNHIKISELSFSPQDRTFLKHHSKYSNGETGFFLERIPEVGRHQSLVHDAVMFQVSRRLVEALKVYLLNADLELTGTAVNSERRHWFTEVIYTDKNGNLCLTWSGFCLDMTKREALVHARKRADVLVTEDNYGVVREIHTSDDDEELRDEWVNQYTLEEWFTKSIETRQGAVDPDQLWDQRILAIMDNFAGLAPMHQRWLG